ncbi:unnamed protein product [Nippostrongylus brasiliensis]|uniref:Secreted protein n=1 Tax=Nippostrongylus brasiliensis TaxID=27835 RepID=A0A0N4XYM4_NIPBR|nr:unnamed protein product [Nippostrongylus brasiliensis]
MRAVVYNLILAVHTFACVPDLDYLPPAIMQRDAPKATGNDPLPVDSSKVYGLKTGTKQRSFYQSSTLVRRQENTSSDSFYSLPYPLSCAVGPSKAFARSESFSKVLYDEAKRPLDNPPLQGFCPKIGLKRSDNLELS